MNVSYAYFFAKYKKIPKSAISRVRKKRSRDRFLQNLVAGYMCVQEWTRTIRIAVRRCGR